VFTESTHIVAIATTGHVYAYETLQELNFTPKNWFCLMTDGMPVLFALQSLFMLYTNVMTLFSEPFKKKDVITIQDPQNIQGRDINSFHYKLEGKTVDIPQSDTDSATKATSAGINAKGATARVLASISSSSSSKPTVTPTPSFVSSKKKAYNETAFSDNAVAASFTSLGAVAYTTTQAAKLTDDEVLIRGVKGNARVLIHTNLGVLDIEVGIGFFFLFYRIEGVVC
jgi:peptidyl-prolyl cis-trans isomerase-like 2